MMTISEATKAAFDRTGAKPIWVAEMHLGAFAYLTVLGWADGSADTVTLQVVHSGGTVTRDYVEGTDFDAATSNAVTAQAIADAINADTGINTRVSAFVVNAMVIAHGYAMRDKVQEEETVDRVWFETTDATAWKSEYRPIDRVYRFSNQPIGSYSIPEIRSVTSVEASIDPRTRQTSIGSVSIEFDDPNERSVIRELLSHVFPRGRYVRLFVGMEGLPTYEFVPVGGYFIDDVNPGLGAITISCAEMTSILYHKEFRSVPNPVGLVVSNPPEGSGASITITIVDMAGDAVTQTYTEGSNWTGDSFVVLSALAQAINEDTTVNPFIGAVTIASPMQHQMFIVPIPFGDPATNRAKSLSVVVNNDGGVTRLRFLSAKIVEEQELGVNGFMHMHPLEALRNLYDFAGLNAQWIDETSFDRASHPTWSHWGMSAHASYATDPPYIEESPDNVPDLDVETGAFDLQASICTQVQGGVWADETGIIGFHRYDPDASPVRHLTEDDYDDTFEWLEQYEDLTNKVIVKGRAFGGNEKLGDEILFEIDDLFSQEMHSSRSDTNPDVVVIDEQYLGQFCPAIDTTSNLITGHLLLTGAWRAAIPGCRTIRADDDEQDELDMIDPGTRDAWILVVAPETGQREIMRVLSASPTTPTESIPAVAPSTTKYQLRQTADPGETSVYAYLPGDGVVDIYDAWWLEVERAQLGTTEQYFGTEAVFVADITIAKSMAEHQMRFSRGLPRARFRTTARHIDLQVGDAITHDAKSYLDLFANGPDAGTTWEITGKEVDFPGINWTIARLKRSA